MFSNLLALRAFSLASSRVRRQTWGEGPAETASWADTPRATTGVWAGFVGTVKAGSVRDGPAGLTAVGCQATGEDAVSGPGRAFHPGAWNGALAVKGTARATGVGGSCAFPTATTDPHNVAAVNTAQRTRPTFPVAMAFLLSAAAGKVLPRPAAEKLARMITFVRRGQAADVTQPPRAAREDAPAHADRRTPGKLGSPYHPLR